MVSKLPIFIHYLSLNVFNLIKISKLAYLRKTFTAALFDFFFQKATLKLITVTTGSNVCMCMHVQSCLILCDHMDCSPPGSSVHGIL